MRHKPILVRFDMKLPEEKYWKYI